MAATAASASPGRAESGMGRAPGGDLEAGAARRERQPLGRGPGLGEPRQSPRRAPECGQCEWGRHAGRAPKGAQRSPEPLATPPSWAGLGK
ncbi:hypothetical protein NN561_015159 [Cricetulus griseus]